MKCLLVNLCVALLLIVPNTYAQSSRNIYVNASGKSKQKVDNKNRFATIEDALNQVKMLKKSKFNGQIEVVVEGGSYYLTNNIVLDETFSGSEGAPFVLRAAEGEQVVFSAGSILNDLNWENGKNGIWKAKVANVNIIEDLYANGKKLIKARYPNYNPNILPFNGYSKDAIAKERVAKWKNPEGGYVHALHEGKWGGFHFIIKGKDSNGELILEGGHQNNRPSPMHESFRFVENILEELDDTNEWYFDQKSATLYFKPEDGKTPQQYKFETARLENIITIAGKRGNPVKNIQIKGIDFVYTAPTFMKTDEPLLRSDWMIHRGGAVVLEHTENCEVVESNFYNLGGNAVFVSNYNRNARIVGNLIEQIGASAISFVGDPKAVRSPSFRYEEFVNEKDLDVVAGPKTDNYPKDCEASNNLIRNIGLVEKQVAGVQISMSESIKVYHNTIYDIPRAGINIGDGTWGGHDLAYNDVFNNVLETSDHGAFNSWGRDRFWHPDRSIMDELAERRPELILLDAIKTTIIRNNRFRCDHGWDIDLDDGSSNYTIYNNLCLSGGIKLREGFHRTVFNNITVNNGFHPHVWFKNSHDVFRNNIVMLAHQDIRVDYWGDTIDYNYYVRQDHLDADRAKGLEKNARVISPEFRNPAQGDFTLISDIPEGFKNFEMDNFGVTNLRLKKLAASPEIPELTYDKVSDTKSFNLLNYKGATLKTVETLGEQSAAGLPTMEGVMITKFDDQSYLNYNGFMVNDVIVELEGEPIRNTADLDDLLKKFHYYHVLNFTIYRNQVKQKIVLNL